MSESDLLTPRERAALERNPDASLSNKTERDDEVINREERGVGGWLAFLVAALVFLGPAFSILMTIGQHEEVSSLYPELLDTAEWKAAMTLDWSMLALQIILSVAAGGLLYKRFERTTVWAAIALIWASAVGTTILSLILADNLFSGSASAADWGRSLGRPLVFSVIWTAYLLLSKRVKRTYI